MVLILAAALGKVIYEEVKDHRRVREHAIATDTNSINTTTATATIHELPSRPTRPRLTLSRLNTQQLNKPLPSLPSRQPLPERPSSTDVPSSSTSNDSGFGHIPIMGVYHELADAPPPYQAVSTNTLSPPTIPERSHLRVRVGNDIVPWSPDDVTGFPEVLQIRRPSVASKVFELE